MATVTAFCLTNLGFDLSEEDLKVEVIRVWGGHLQHFNVKLFERDENQRKGVVSGFSAISLALLQELSRGKKIKGRNICLKPDAGERRDKYGRFQELATPLARKERDKTHGVNFKKLFVVFHPELIADLERNTVSKKIFTISPVVAEDILNKLGFFTKFHPTEGIPNGSVCVRYHTSLETMQAMLYLSGNYGVSNPPPTISSPFHRNVCRTKMGAGMGTDGRILDFAALNRNFGGYVPFQVFKSTLLNCDLLGLTNGVDPIASKCWRCGDSYKLLGIDLELGYVAGRCVCAYNDDELDANRRWAYAWNQETFTRLVLGNSDPNTGLYQNLRILHVPMCNQYLSPNHYRQILLPILEDEWKVHAGDFKESHKHQARLISATHVEKAKVKRKGKEKIVDIFALHLEVKTTKLWCSKERSALRELYLPLIMTVNGQVRASPENHKARIRSVQERNGLLHIFAQARFAPSTKPQSPQILEISAKANKTEYKATRRALNKFVELSIQRLSHTYLQLLLNPNNGGGWEIQALEYEEDVEFQDLSGLQYLLETLNVSQRQSFDQAMAHSLTIIQGPPGTGKSYNVSVLAIALAIQEKGTVVACAPSNEAADNLAENISTLLKANNIPISVLRVESKSKEAAVWERHEINATDAKKPYDVLQDLVALSLTRFPQDGHLEPIFEAWMNGQSHMLKLEDRESLNSYIANIEKLQARLYAIQVYTIATLGDGRANSFSKITPITTIIADEVGQATQTSLIMFEKLSPKRIVLTGDHLQLQPHVESQSAADAGLNKSPLELASPLYMGSQDCSTLPPWTLLNTQYRMAPSIRKLVSEVVYDGKLLDDVSITSRWSQLPSGLSERPLVILNHESAEVKVGQSYSNPGEADLVVKYVGELLQKGVKPHLITILSLYEAQKVEIERKLKIALPTMGIQVLNVDAFQGRENAVIIVSFTRSNAEKSVGFTRCPNRLNVAISRAKEILAVAADMSTFQSVFTRNWKIFNRIMNEEAFKY